jgi:serine/threonine protein kinase
MPPAKTHNFLDPPIEDGDLGTLGHYRVLGELGKGGMGHVFLAEDIKLRRRVALKVMNQKIAATPNSRRRFIHEARAMAAVHHDNVATIFEVGEANNTPFMAMEMLKGSTLETFNKSKTKLRFEEVIHYAKQITRGLAAAHAKGIVHRDIKPANIWLEEGNNRIKILDFGLALASTPVDHLAGRGAVIGTPGYLSPEQARSEPLDDRSDLYSLGVVLYELCTCKLPIQSTSVPGQLISILAHRPTPINELNPDIPQPLCDLIHRLLRKEPRMRPKSAAFLEQELERTERECHAKSEVAQAINKLQLGLSEVVSKTANESFFATAVEVQASIPNPLAIPAPVTRVPPARPMAADVAKKAAPAKSWQAYWPIAAIGALVLIALPVLTFTFSGAGRDNTAYVISADTEPNPNPNPNPSPSPPPNATLTPQAAVNPGNNGNPNNGPKPPQGENKQPDKPESHSQPEKSPAPPNEAPPANDSAPVVAPTSPPPAPEPTAPPANVEPQPAPQVPMVWTTISTADGRGADTLVQKGVATKSGLKPSFGIGSRNGVETAHSYLRFDLAAVEDAKGHVESAELILTFLTGKDLACKVRLFGITDIGLWPEDGLEWKNTFSSQGLDKFPLLGELTVVDDEAVEQFEGRKVIRFATPELAKFIKESPSDTLTLVLTGIGATDEIVRFVSRENTMAQRPPKLKLHVPVNPPVDEKKKQNKR